MPANGKNLTDLFVTMLRDMYFAEKHILKALPKMAKAARADELREAFETHHAETEQHVERLDEVFRILGKRAQGKTCEAIVGIVAEATEIMEEFEDSLALDAGLVAAAQAVEHYEIARYGAMKQWARDLGLHEVVNLLEENLWEEKETDRVLSEIAESGVNFAAQPLTPRESGRRGGARAGRG